MNQAASILYKHEDFECFSKVKTGVHTFNCNITNAQWIEKGNELTFHISANRFLRNMVRAIVGTLLDIGQQKIEVYDLHQIIKYKNRGNDGTSAPAHGLYLMQVKYPNEIMNSLLKKKQQND